MIIFLKHKGEIVGTINDEVVMGFSAQRDDENKLTVFYAGEEEEYYINAKAFLKEYQNNKLLGNDFMEFGMGHEELNNADKRKQENMEWLQKKESEPELGRVAAQTRSLLE